MLSIPGWEDLSRRKDIPPIWLTWLAKTGSMTRALEQAFDMRCQIIVQQEGWQWPWYDESTVLACKEICWIREVIIITRQPVMFARSVFPRQLLTHFPQFMALDSQPLGHIIFRDKTFQRGPIEVAEIASELSLWQQLPVALRPEKCWARRSLFYSTLSPFLLSEVFLCDVATF